MKLLIDMNLTPRWAPYLSASGWETLHWSAAGPVHAKDREICQWARENDFVVVTNDLTSHRFWRMRAPMDRALSSSEVNR
jgi:predicted nuclease of predicted toxin-antitoxin system